MRRKVRNWVMGLLWRWGFVELPFWDDVRIVVEERRERVPTVSGEWLREALAGRRSA